MEKILSGANNSQVNLFLVERLKKEINALADRLTADLKRENATLIRRIAALKAENERLNRELYGSYDPVIRCFTVSARTPANGIQRPKNH